MEMKMKINGLAAMVLPVIIFGILGVSCDPSKKWEKDEKRQIESFIATRGDTVYEHKPSGLYITTIQEGTGIAPDDKDTVSIRFTGYFLDYRIFDSNIGLTQPLSFILGSGYIIEGLDEGISYMKKGGRAKMVTPSSLAYGGMGIRGILSGYTPLLWDIQVVEVKPVSKK
jgi:FKBP-type peptidyl-prolyl cis-trans isomerase